MTTATITANLVKELRERTNVGMMECKKALVETQGDIEAAIDFLRKSGQLKAAKKEGRITAEGLIVIKTSTDGKLAIILEINCETDFVARDSNFVEFADRTADMALQHKKEDVKDISELAFDAEKTIEQARQELVAKIGENITIRRAQLIHSEEPIGSYSHGGRIGAVVVMKGGNENLGKDMAMQVTASNPKVARPEEVSAESLAKEKEIFLAQNENSGKPADILAKMVEGKLKKFAEEVSLTGQPYVKDPNIKVSDYLKQNKAEVISFVRFEVGEGIEKVVTNFAEEVMAQVRGA